MLSLNLNHDGENEGQVFFDRQMVSRFSRVTPTLISLTRHFQPDRKKVEAFIEKVYADKYGAQVTTHYPYLMSARDSQGQILAAIGFRPAADDALFLEHYLDAPIEHEVSARLGQTIARRNIVELGSLASQGQGATFFLFMVLANYLNDQGYSHAAITGTRVLHRFFSHLGLDPQPLAAADKTRLPDGGRNWGRYYDKAPQVLCGDIAAGCRLLPVNQPKSGTTRRRLFTRLHRPLTGGVK